MQPTYVHTWQQEPECSSRCGMEGSFRESPGTQPGRADSAWTSLADSFPEAGLMLHWLRGPALQQSCRSFYYKKDKLSPASGKGPKAKGSHRRGEEHRLLRGGQGFDLDIFAP